MNAAQAPTATPDKPGSTQGIACTHLEARCTSGGNRQRKLWCPECRTWVDKFMTEEAR